MTNDIEKLNAIKSQGVKHRSAQFILLSLVRCFGNSDDILKNDIQEEFIINGIETRNEALVSNAEKIAETLDTLPSNSTNQNLIKYQNQIHDLTNNFRHEKFINYKLGSISHVELQTAITLVDNIIADDKIEV